MGAAVAAVEQIFDASVRAGHFAMWLIQGEDE